MAQNTARKRREAVEENAEAAAARVAAHRNADHRYALVSLCAVLVAAAVSALALLLLSFNARELWTPFAGSGARILRDLLLSGAIGGSAVALLVPRSMPPLAAAGCAVGWGLIGFSQHLVASSQFGTYMSMVIPGGPNFGRQAMGTFLQNATLQPLCAVAGLLVATAICQALGRRLHENAPSAEEPATPSDDPAAGSGAGNALGLALSLLGGGLALFWLLGWVLLRVLHDPALSDLPVPLARAVPCAVVAVLAFGVVGYFGERVCAGGAIPFVLAAPAAVTLMGMAMQSTASPGLFIPASSLLWNSSPFEMASWGAFGALAGRWARQVNSAEAAP